MPRPRKYHTRPDWPDASQAQVDYFADEFRGSLRQIAERLARHEEAVNVDPRHVKEAFGVLSRMGLTRRVWWKRTEFEVGAGSFLFTLGLASPDVLTQFIGEGAAVGSIAVAVSITGGLVAIHGWFRGKQ